MNKQEIIKHIDHTALQPTATEADIKKLCDEAMHYGCASVCIPSCYVGFAKRYVGGKMKICTVVGFPNGSPPLPPRLWKRWTLLFRAPTKLTWLSIWVG